MADNELKLNATDTATDTVEEVVYDENHYGGDGI